jgi:hypothetical protein
MKAMGNWIRSYRGDAMPNAPSRIWAAIYPVVHTWLSDWDGSGIVAIKDEGGDPHGIYYELHLFYYDAIDLNGEELNHVQYRTLREAKQAVQNYLSSHSQSARWDDWTLAEAGVLE